MSKKTTVLRIVTVPVAAAAFLAFAGAASANAQPVAQHTAVAGVQAASTASVRHDFWIKNTSQYSMVLTGYDGKRNEDEMPGTGTRIEPGTSADLKMAWFVFESRTTIAHFDLVDVTGKKAGTYDIDMRTSIGDASASARWSGVQLQNTWSRDTWGAWSEAHVQDPPGTVVNVAPDQNQKQAAVLEKFCASGTAQCTFTPKGQMQKRTATRTLLAPLFNGSQETNVREYSITDSVGTNESIGLKASVKVSVMKVVEAGIESTYSSGITTQHTFSEKVTIKIPPYHVSWVEGNSPVLRTTGDFKVKIGNVTWNLTDVYFDTPDTDAKMSYSIKERKMTDEEKGIA